MSFYFNSRMPFSDRSSQFTNSTNAFIPLTYAPLQPQLQPVEDPRKKRIKKSSEEIQFVTSLIENQDNIDRRGHIQWSKITPIVNAWLESRGLEGSRTSRSYASLAKSFHKSSNASTATKIELTKSVTDLTSSMKANPKIKNFFKPILKQCDKENHPPVENSDDTISHGINKLTPFYRYQTEKNLPRDKLAIWSEWNRGIYQGPAYV